MPGTITLAYWVFHKSQRKENSVVNVAIRAYPRGEPFKSSLRLILWLVW